MTDCFVGFDTSNYTTSMAVCDRNGKILANWKLPLSVGEGQRGLRQSDAVFAHVRNLPVLTSKFQHALANEAWRPIGVGVSVCPRNAEHSYMPCFLAGKAAAYAFAAADGLPVCECSHQNGHIMAALHSSQNEERLKQAPFFAFHVSGGTTEVLLVQPQQADFGVQLIGGTRDLNAGQLIDRVGVAMGLPFPCGKQMEELATCYQGKIYRHPVCVREGYGSLSGAENIALRLWNETGKAEAVAAFVFDFICRTLLQMGEQAEEQYGKMPMLFAGGVMSNQWMRGRLAERWDASFAEAEFSSDNAAGICLLCRAKMGEDETR